MQATLTDMQRSPKKVIRPVQNGQSIQITEHGRPFAKVSPDYPVVIMTEADFRALPITDEALDKAINEAVEAARA